MSFQILNPGKIFQTDACFAQSQHGKKKTGSRIGIGECKTFAFQILQGFDVGLFSGDNQAVVEFRVVIVNGSDNQPGTEIVMGLHISKRPEICHVGFFVFQFFNGLVISFACQHLNRYSDFLFQCLDYGRVGPEVSHGGTVGDNGDFKGFFRSLGCRSQRKKEKEKKNDTCHRKES